MAQTENPSAIGTVCTQYEALPQEAQVAPIAANHTTHFLN